MNSRFIVVSTLLILMTHSQKGNSLEPGYPDLAGYQFLESAYYLTKIWISSEQQTPLLLEAEFVPADSNLSRLLESGQFDRPELLGDSDYDEQVLYLSVLPAKHWNHGNELDDLLEQVKVRRSKDIRQQLLRYVLQKVAREDFNTPMRNDYFSRADSYQFPITDDFKFITLILDVQWRQFDIRGTLKNQQYLIDIKY